MKTKVLSDVELRARWTRSPDLRCEVEEGTILTPAAKDFAREHQIEITFRPSRPVCQVMPRTPIPVKNGKARYVNALTGEELLEKPEDWTHLSGNRLVPKQHPRIAFRGQLDALMAEIMVVQTEAEEDPRLVEELEELLGYVRRILGAEVKEVPLEEIRLLGLDSAGLRYTSHHVKEEIGIDHPVPNCGMGRICVLLNRLRTQVRACELSAVTAFMREDGTCSRKDIVEALNRLSSCVYILFCRKAAGYYEREKVR